MNDDELQSDGFSQLFRALREQAIDLSSGFTRSVREQIDELAASGERQPPSLMSVLMGVVVDATNLVAGLRGSSSSCKEQQNDDD